MHFVSSKASVWHLKCVCIGQLAILYILTLYTCRKTVYITLLLPLPFNLALSDLMHIGFLKSPQLTLKMPLYRTVNNQNVVTLYVHKSKRSSTPSHDLSQYYSTGWIQQTSAHRIASVKVFYLLVWHSIFLLIANIVCPDIVHVQKQKRCSTLPYNILPVLFNLTITDDKRIGSFKGLYIWHSKCVLIK